MVKVILGSAAGGFAAAGLMIGAWMLGQSRGPSAEIGAVTPALAASVMPTASCGPMQEPAVARVMVNGQEIATLACVDRVLASAATYPAMAQPGPQFHYAPAQPAPVYRTPVAPPVRRVAYRPADDQIVRYEPDVRPQTRSVAKTAMIIGGSAGAGAGVGGLVGGKKGALIGAAIGGGAASIFEATKR